MSLDRDAKVSFTLFQGIESWESAHGKEFTNKDGSINKAGMKERSYLKRHNSSYNDLKWDNYMFFHLDHRTPTIWKDMIKNKRQYGVTGDSWEYFYAQQLLNDVRIEAVYISKTNLCKQCKGNGVDYDMSTPRGKCPTCKGKGRIKKDGKRN